MTKKVMKVKESGPLKAKCDYCGKKKVILYGECDPEWELKGHPDHIFRMVCHGCGSEVSDRYDCAFTLFEAMGKLLIERGMGSAEIIRAQHLVWRTIHVNLDIKAFMELAQQLKINHPWLKRKKSK